jgi:hypothetical protein
MKKIILSIATVLSLNSFAANKAIKTKSTRDAVLKIIAQMDRMH